MPQYLLLLGNTPELSSLEIKSLISKPIQAWSNQLLSVSLESDQAAQDLMKISGGLVKILKIVHDLGSKEELDSQSIYHQIADSLLPSEDKITFSLTDLIGFELNNQGLKKVLRQKGQSVRYRRSDQFGLSAAVLLHESTVADLFVVCHKQQVYLAKTVAIQNIDDWTQRDRDKPYAQRRQGMLPPKVARMMVNIGLGKLAQLTQQSLTELKPVVYDPFCGAGNILIEALLRGAEAVGSDLNEQAVAGCLENLYWLEKVYQQEFKYKVFHSEVTQADQFDWQVKPNLIVTEPFLGKQTPKKHELSNIFKGLYRLYLGAFKTWSQILADQAVVVIIFPFVNFSQKNRYDWQKLIDKLAKYGYTLEVAPVAYFRQGAQVKREIFVFKYHQVTK